LLLVPASLPLVQIYSLSRYFDFVASSRARLSSSPPGHEAPRLVLPVHQGAYTKARSQSPPLLPRQEIRLDLIALVWDQLHFPPYFHLVQNWYHQIQLHHLRSCFVVGINSRPCWTQSRPQSREWIRCVLLSIV